MAINFPGSPTLYQIFTSGENSFIWNGKQWVGYSTSLTVNYNASSVALESNNAVVGATTTFNFDNNFSISYNSGISTVGLSTVISEFTSIGFKTDTVATISAGDLSWNSSEGTLDIGLLNDVTLQVGQEQYFYAKAVAPITNGQLIMFAGVQGDHALITPSDLQSVGFRDTYIMGVATQDFATNDFGYVTSFGKVGDLNTEEWNVGDILYADPNNVGVMTNVQPSAPNHSIQIAAVLRSHQNAGIILVRPTFGFFLNDLHDVGIDTTTLSDNDVLIYDSSTGIWGNSQLPISSQWVTTASGIHTLSNVGVGTTNPTSALTVKGDTSLETLSVSDVSIFSGNIGIGTTDPISQLDVLGTVNFDCNDGNTFTSVGIGTSIVDISTPLLSVYAPNIAINTPGGYFQTDVDTFILNSGVISLNSLFPQTFTLPTISITSSASGLPATFTLGQNIDGSGEDHLGLIYDNFGGTAGVGGTARIFTSNGDLKIVTDYNGTSTGSNITIGSEDIIFTDKTETQEYVRITSSGVGIGTTNIIGQLQISTGPAIIGAATSTGTSSQTLQVTGGAYVSDNLGIGITNPTSKIQVQGDINVSGVITSSTRLSTGQTGVAINITQDTISGPTQITIDPSAVGDDTGSVRIKGDLFVDGTQTVINSTSIELADFNVGIATTVGSNELLDGAGIGIGSTGIRKTLTWDSNTSALKSSENFNLAAGKVYEIDGTTLLSSTQLTVDNVNSSGVTTTGFITATNAYVGVLTASTINGDGTNIVGIVTQIISGIGIDLVSTQSQGKGSVTVTSYKPIGKTIYVSQNGNDSNTGLAENYPKRTVKNAAGIASSGDTIKVFPGVYVENNPIVLQKTVSVEGTELRNCVITPQNPGLDLFHVNNGCHITDLSFVGSDSTNGAAVIAFQPLAGVSSNRFFDAARMIRMNLDYIAAEATGYISSTAYQSPVVAINTANYRNYIRSTCLAICHDITRGGNSKCVGVGLSFYTEGVINAGIGTTTIDALKYAVGIAQSCINNVSWIGGFQNEFTQIKDLSTQADPATGSNIDINSCSNVISALNSCVGVVTTIIGVGTTAVGTLFNRTYPGNSGIGTTNPNDPSYSPGVGPITQGPYVRNCTNFISNSIGMKVDGFAAEPGDQLDIGVTGSMSVDSYTQYNQGGIGVSITNGAYSQLVSIFTICDDIAIFTGSGGQCDITNSNSSFGRLGLVADGVGDSTTKSIYRYTGVATTDTPRGTNTITVSGVGSIRPYDGQVCYFGQLYYFVDTINLTNGGSGYTAPPKVNISAPEGPNGIAAQASTTIDAFGRVTSVNIVNSGTQYSNPPTITIDPPIGVGVSATASVAKMQPIYYKVDSATLPSSGISTVSLLQNLNNTVSAGTTVYFSRVSLQITSSHSFEWVGSGNDINRAKPALGGVVIPENEVVQDNGGIVVYTSTDQAGNFKIGDGVVINQSTGQISGRDFTKALFTTMTPFILALSD